MQKSRYAARVTYTFLMSINKLIFRSFISSFIIYKITVLPAILRSTCHFPLAFTTSLLELPPLRGFIYYPIEKARDLLSRCFCSKAEGWRVPTLLQHQHNQRNQHNQHNQHQDARICMKFASF